MQTKLFAPPLRPSFVPRPHLIEKLTAGLNNKLTLISASAGFGKTTLVTDWLSQGKRPFAWFSLDEDDSDLYRFFTYVAAAIQKIDGAGGTLPSLLQSPQPAPSKSLVTAFINDCLAVSTPFILVLDDFHLLMGTAVSDAVSYLLDNMPPTLQLVITSRTDPLLPLPRLRARGQLTELRTDDLRFSAAEAAAFLQTVMGLRLSVAESKALESRTEGWVAGLQMAALSLQELKTDEEVAAFVSDFTGSHRYIFDYLTDEVLQKRPSDTQAFLLQTSILDRFNASLCTAVTDNPNSQSILQTLDNANLFLFPLDSNRQWYRYHRLFADLLQHRLAQRPKQERNKLHQQAAQWFEADGIIDQAIKHYKEAEDWEHIAQLIKQYGSESLQPGQLNRLQRWLDALSPEHLQADASLAALQAWIYYFEQKSEQVAFWVEQALHQLETSDTILEEKEPQLQGSLIGLRAWLTIQQGRFKVAIQLAEKALAILPATNPIWQGIVYIFLGQALFGAGRTAEAIAAYETSLQFNNEVSNWIATSALIDAIMMTLMFRGHLNEARKKLDRIIAMVMPSGEAHNSANLRLARLAILYEQNELKTYGSELSELQNLTQFDGRLEAVRYQYLLARYYTAVGERKQALHLLSQIETNISSWTTPDEQARALASTMRIYLSLGKREKPLAWLNSLTIDWSQLSLLRITEYLAVADILRFSESRQAQQDGLERLKAIHALCDETGMISFKIDVYCLQALLMCVVDDESEALVAIRSALDMAAPEQYIRTFVDFWQPMAALLQRAISHNIHPDYAGFLLTQFDVGKKPQQEAVRQQTDDPLSERELEVLALLATHLTGPEIADHLHISRNTFKTHAKNIYSKLDVSSRATAVTQAQELNLLSS